MSEEKVKQALESHHAHHIGEPEWMVL